MKLEAFIKKLETSYRSQQSSILMGSAVYENRYDLGLTIHLPLSTLNRHGLISGATGTGKTKTLQVMAENLSEQGIPVMVMDIKGDLSGLGAAGSDHPKIQERVKFMELDWRGKQFPIEFMTISNEPGTKLRATISEYGPILLAKILGLNENQTGGLSMIFKFCDDRALPLLDFKDLKGVLRYIQEEGKQDFKKEYGFIHTNSIGAIMRSIIALEQQKVDHIFGEPSFEVEDLMYTNSNGEGVINILRLTDMQTKPALFSTFMLCLLSELFQKMPEEGDLEAPKLVLFIDEPHLLFKNASQTLLDQFETTVKLIRSKGIGIFLVTQSPIDIPPSILGQLGTKIQHALRAFTARDRKAIKAAAENFPETEFYEVDKLLTTLGTGEAIISGLDEKGRPTPLAHTLIRPPFSRMDVLSNEEITDITNQSRLMTIYNRQIDRESAYEILQEKIADKAPTKPVPPAHPKPSNFEKFIKSSAGQTIIKEVTRGLMGVLGLRRSRRRR